MFVHFDTTIINGQYVNWCKINIYEYLLRLIQNRNKHFLERQRIRYCMIITEYVAVILRLGRFRVGLRHVLEKVTEQLSTANTEIHAELNGIHSHPIKSNLNSLRP